MQSLESLPKILEIFQHSKFGLKWLSVMSGERVQNFFGNKRAITRTGAFAIEQTNSDKSQGQDVQPLGKRGGGRTVIDSFQESVNSKF